MQSLREMMELVETGIEAPGFYAHVTNLNNLKSIKAKGLVPNFGGGNYDDIQWTSLEGVYASKNAEMLSRYLSAHGHYHYGIVVIEVRMSDALPDEDIIDINLSRAFEKALHQFGVDDEEVSEQVEENDGVIDPSQPLWRAVLGDFSSTLGQPAGNVPEGFIEQLVDFWFTINYLGGGDALMDWGHLKDTATRLFPRMTNAHTGDQHSIRIPNVVGFEGATRIVALIAVHGGTMPEVIYNKVPAEAEEEVDQFVYDIINA